MIGFALLNRYYLQAELGRGARGVVYQAHDTLLDRDVAVKVLVGPDPGGEGRDRFLHEAQAAARLNHPNIVRIYDVGEAELPEQSGPAPFIIMELVDGHSLHDRPSQSLDEIISVGRQICAALAHAHAHGIVHRDVKPENVMLTTAGSAKLLDLGLARPMASRLTVEGSIQGTVLYLAPELALGQPYDGRADLYALGVLLYELLTGRLPFTGDDPVAVISQHLYAPVTPPRAHNEQVPPALDALVVQLLSKRPEDRPASAQDVLRALEGLASTGTRVEVAGELPLLDRVVYGRIVGREHELAEARDSWQRAVCGELQVLLISGEPGIGKTRFVQEFATRVEVTGGRVLAGECYAEGGAPYAPIAHMIRRVEQSDPACLGRLPQLVQADLLALAPDLQPAHPEVPPNPQLDTQSEQRRVFESAVALFGMLAQQSPLLLFVDDAHWADSGTLSLLRYVARRMRTERVAIVLTYREAELDTARALNDVLNDLNRERLALRIKLGRLTRDQTRDLLAAMFSEEPAPEFIEAIYRETEGNPFFVEEVCKALIENGKLHFADGRWHRPSMAELDIPQSVRVAIQSRVGKLPETVQETLRLAALQGREFDYAVLKATSDLDEDTLIDALERAERAQLISEVKRTGPGTFVFVHVLIPSTLRDSLSGLRRHRLHRRVAAALEAVHPDDYETLAYHYGEAGDEEHARAYYIQAGDRARRLVALDDAVRQYRAALRYWSGGDAAGRAEALHKLGECQWVTGDLQGALQTLETAYALFEGLGDPQQAGDMLRMMGRLHWELADRQAAMADYERALAMLAQGPETAELARAVSAISQAHMIMIDFDKAIQWGERALELAERLNARDVILHALNNIGTSRTLVQAYDQERGLDMQRDSLQRARALDLPYEIGRASYNLGESLFGLGRYAEARPLFEELYAYGTRIHSLLFTGLGLRLLMELDWKTGHWAAALARRAEALEVTGGTAAVWQGTIFSAMNNDLGRPGSAREEMERMFEQTAKVDQIQTLVPCLGQLARAYDGLGMEAEAAGTIQQYLEMVDQNPFLHWVCDAPLLFACRWHARRAAPGAALDATWACLKRLERAHAQMNSPSTGACLAEGRALVLMAAGELPQAIVHGRAAVAAWEALGHPYDCARALGSLGRALAGAGEVEAAGAALERALQTVDSLAAQLVTEELKKPFMESPLVRELRAAREGCTKAT